MDIRFVFQTSWTNDAMEMTFLLTKKNTTKIVSFFSVRGFW